MKAIILAAGQGTRLKKYTENLPKGMLIFGGKTIIERQIETYRRCGIDDIVIVTGFAADKIQYTGIKYYKNEDFENTNMVESLLTAKAEFVDDCIISYSDILFEDRLLDRMIAAEGEYSVAVDDEWKFYWMMRYGREDFDTESLRLGEDDNIVELGKENPSLDNIDARYIGLLKFTRKGLARIVNIMKDAYSTYSEKPWQQSGKTAKQAYMTDLLNALIEDGETIKAVRFNHGWMEFDTNKDYEKALQWEKDGQIKKIIMIDKRK